MGTNIYVTSYSKNNSLTVGKDSQTGVPLGGDRGVGALFRISESHPENIRAFLMKPEKLH